jgi:hypothetical protein
VLIDHSYWWLGLLAFLQMCLGVSLAFVVILGDAGGRGEVDALELERGC